MSVVAVFTLIRANPKPTNYFLSAASTKDFSNFLGDKIIPLWHFVFVFININIQLAYIYLN